MTDLEISKQLALAIGWAEDRVDAFDLLDPDIITVDSFPGSPKRIECWDEIQKMWRIFDYRDWAVAGPIAERYDCFPYSWHHNAGTPCWRASTALHDTNANTPQKAIALAVIEGMNK